MVEKVDMDDGLDGMRKTFNAEWDAARLKKMQHEVWMFRLSSILFAVIYVYSVWGDYSDVGVINPFLVGIAVIGSITVVLLNKMLAKNTKESIHWMKILNPEKAELKPKKYKPFKPSRKYENYDDLVKAQFPNAIRRVIKRVFVILFALLVIGTSFAWLEIGNGPVFMFSIIFGAFLLGVNISRLNESVDVAFNIHRYVKNGGSFKIGDPKLKDIHSG